MSLKNEREGQLVGIAELKGIVENADGTTNVAYHITTTPGVDTEAIAQQLAEKTNGRVLSDEEVASKRLNELIQDHSDNGRSFSVGAKNWNSSWEPKGPKPPWKRTKTDD